MAKILSEEFRVRLSRNAVISRARRIGLSRSPPALTAMQPPKRVYPAKPKPVIVALPTVTALALVEAPEAPPPNPKSLLDLREDDCRYPFGNWPFMFCGCRKLADSSYCLTHTRRTRGTMGYRREL